MRARSASYLILAVLGLAATVGIPVMIERSGIASVPAWISIASPGPLSSAHAFLDADCEACHKPNDGISATGCIGCHTQDMTALAMQSTAFHADIQDCAGCHIEHRGRSPRPTVMDHGMLARIGWGRSNDKVSPQSAMTEISHLRAVISGRHTADDAAVLDCFTCHSNRNPHRDGQAVSCCGERPAPTVGSLFGRDCSACHGTATWKIADYQHPSQSSKDCAQCHTPPPSHGMMHFEMVSKAVAGQEHASVEQCFLCHQTDSWNDIKGVGWYKHH